MNYDEVIWRPLDLRGTKCRYFYKGELCLKQGAHHCLPRAQRFIDFCSEFLKHTTGPLARQPFILEPWQEHEIAHPVFGEVIWSDDWQRYVRRFEIVSIVMGRKNGKSAIAAAFVLYLLVADFEESAEIYGAAADTKQAAKVYQPVQRMMTLSPVLSQRLKENKAARRISDLATNSYYEIIASDAQGELGHNPHGFVLDEVLSQPDRDLWDALRTAAGARAQAMFLAITTETNDDSSFGAALIDEAEKIQYTPEMSSHTFAWVRKTPRDADPWDEANWYHANPALGTFKSIEVIRKQAEEAQNDPDKENAFRQFQLNQRVQQKTRWMPMVRWKGNPEWELVNEEEFYGKPCFGGLDLASVTDLAALSWLFPPEDEQGIYHVVWRFWTPEATLPSLDEYTAGRATAWARQGLLIVTEGDWIDYYGDKETGLSYNNVLGIEEDFAIHPKIADDANKFDVQVVGYDRAQATATAQYMDLELDLNIDPITQGSSLSGALKEIMRRVKAGKLNHGNHPVANWCFDSVEVKRDLEDRIKVVKPDRKTERKRVDGVVSLANAVQAELRFEEEDKGYFDIMNSIF